MEWTEEAVVLGTKRHGETSAILHVFTRLHGCHHGLVRGARSRTMRPVLQAGNIVKVEWRARLEEHLGNFKVEALTMRGVELMDRPFALSGLTALAALCQVLPEREPHPRLYDAFRLVLDALGDDDIWPALLVRWELGLLEDLGFGLDLSKCAATGVRDNLAYVSPKSGRAVSADAGRPYRDKLFNLPPFLLGSQAGVPTPRELADAFDLTEFFLNRHVFEARGLHMPEQRGWIAARLKSDASK